MKRVGLLNFWYYDEEIFEAEEGRLLASIITPGFPILGMEIIFPFKENAFRKSSLRRLCRRAV
jgi:hypothetical protein